MKILKISAAFLLIANAVFSQTYTPKDTGSKVHFVIKNFGFNTGGDFTGLKGSIVFNSKTPGTGKFNVTVDAKTIDTDNDTRDRHLRKSEYFDVETYPFISFVSTKITESAKAGLYTVTGNLTIKGITKTMQFDFSATPSAQGYLFKGDFEMNRRDFGVGGSSISMSDNLKVSLTIAAYK